MTTPHVIRLRGPWEHEALAGGGVRSTRKFNCPTNLESGEHVWLVCEGFEHPYSVALNDRPLGEVTAFRGASRFDISADLQPHNRLAIDVALPADATPPADRHETFGEVRLEIGPEHPPLDLPKYDPRL